MHFFLIASTELRLYNWTLGLNSNLGFPTNECVTLVKGLNQFASVFSSVK